MSLPNFLTSSSPPRSPHILRSGYFDAMIPAVASSGSPASFRPTRREMIICCLTLSFSYLMFSTQVRSDPILLPTKAIEQKHTPSWKNMWSSKHSCPVPTERSETSFTESVQSYGLQPAPIDELIAAEGTRDGGEEEQEDDVVFPGETKLLAHQPGWTMFNKLYIHNGSFYVVTHEMDIWPDLRLMTSTGLPAIPGNGADREPKGDEIIYISADEASKIWGPRVYMMEGTTWLWNDGQFMDHYYHFAAELLMGSWRAHASGDLDITAKGATTIAAPRRIWFLHQHANEWRDVPRFNPTILFNLFPSTAVLYPEDFEDLAKSTRSHLGSAFVLERALLADRSAAFRGPYTGPTARTAASALYVGTASRWWWEPVRRQILRYAGIADEILDRNLEGYGALDPAGIRPGPGMTNTEPLAPPGQYSPVVTYISRQKSRRRLTAGSHNDLVNALTERSKKIGFELVVVEAEKLTKEEQFALAGRTTIMLGVHGNGLTHLIWMPATPRSAVIEMFFPGGFARDYQWTAHALGIRHYGVQHDVTFTSPNLPEVAYPEGFQGESITVDGTHIADLIEDRLAGKA